MKKRAHWEHPRDQKSPGRVLPRSMGKKRNYTSISDAEDYGKRVGR